MRIKKRSFYVLSRWFAWRPVRVDDETIVWLEWVEREKSGYGNWSYSIPGSPETETSPWGDIGSHVWLTKEILEAVKPSMLLEKFGEPAPITPDNFWGHFLGRGRAPKSTLKFRRPKPFSTK